MENVIEEIRKKLADIADIERAKQSKRYLKSEYKFYGVRIPELRKIAKEHKDMKTEDVFTLADFFWNSGNHEEMSLALFFLGGIKKKNPEEVWRFLTGRIERAKSWDHIDEMSMHILGEILLENIELNKEIKIMAESKNSWIRRASIVSNYPLIKKNKNELAFLLAEKLVYDSDIYVQKGAGWMIREIGKRDRLSARNFILSHLDMKPWAFSYSIEKMPELKEKREEFLNEK
ncbi:DNA alkylation repair protein [Candidatus Pacearchaeota archaeon]|nr:DNA alkylation repair protein [Candidatus Pacearchaeota archaeon]